MDKRYFVREADNAGPFEIWDRKYHPQNSPIGLIIKKHIADVWNKTVAFDISKALNESENIKCKEIV